MAKQKSDIPAALRKAAIVAYGGAAQAEDWFNYPQAFVVYLRPIDVIKTPKGMKMIKEHVQNQINLNEGVFS
jgi:uncharacterized protein (DUF2384 family)